MSLFKLPFLLCISLCNCTTLAAHNRRLSSDVVTQHNAERKVPEVSGPIVIRILRVFQVRTHGSAGWFVAHKAFGVL